MKLKITNLIELNKKEEIKMSNLSKPMQRRLARKVAYELWQYLSDDKMAIRNCERYIQYLQKELGKFLEKEIDRKSIQALLEIFHTVGYIPENLRLEMFLLARLKRVAIASIREDRKTSGIDD